MHVLVIIRKKDERVKILRALGEAQKEGERLAQELAQVMQSQASEKEWTETSTWYEVVQRWECTETVVDVLVLCVKILREQDPFTQRNLSRQLRRWRREEGRTERGWLEVRMVNGQGPYIYYRWRRPGEREIQTEYYGRGDRMLERLSLGPAISRAGLRRKRGEGE